MSYYVTFSDAKFSIPLENKDQAVEAIKKWVKSNSTNYRLSYYKFILDETELEDIFEKLQWIIVTDAKRKKLQYSANIVGIRFEGEDLGSEEEIFKVISPFVTAGSFIHMFDEDGSHWRWFLTVQVVFVKRVKLFLKE